MFANELFIGRDADKLRSASVALRGLLAVGALLVCGEAQSGSSAERQPGFPTLLDKRVPGILLETTRVELPAGVAIRPVYEKGLSFTKQAEGWVPTLYNDPAGFCTIGYGHLVKKSRCNGSEPPDFRDGFTEAEGERWLIKDMAAAQKTAMLQTMLHVKKVDLTDGQFAALCDFAFNVGGANFKNSTLLKKIREKKFDQVPAQFRRWILADGKELRGLRNRREGEIKLFFDGQQIPRAAPEPGEDLSPLDISVTNSVAP